ncbi:hypothetical protein HOG16_02570 [Candidatus Woesearchaeota archaeon]|jgi:hypothetical protein|nr:hypothetical protein [Candidatus Woesearchaeota archaeon]MBT4321981.1 hypothetical protein [Candidatus Woesearchaeota archaeon]MBT4631333.1 hypothetical protein [Candidatus Woesearchaeota archaeon]
MAITLEDVAHLPRLEGETIDADFDPFELGEVRSGRLFFPLYVGGVVFNYLDSGENFLVACQTRDLDGKIYADLKNLNSFDGYRPIKRLQEG